jgi:hypothetical protein
MVQTMRFAEGTYSVGISEAFNSGIACIYVCSSGGSGRIDMDERHLIEMRNWINRQILKIQKQKQVKK